MSVGILRFITVFCGGIGSASLWTVLLVVLPLIREVEGATRGRLYGHIDHYMDRFNPIMVVLAALSGIVLLVVHYNLSHVSAIFTAIGVVGQLGVGAISLGLVAPLSRQLSGKSTDLTVKAVRRWEAFHRLRTASGLIGFAAFVVGALS